MKRFVIIASMAAMLALTACGGSKENVETTAAQTQAAAQNGEAAAEAKPAETVVALPEEFEPEFFEGTVTGIDNAVVTIVSQDGEAKKFDLASVDAGEKEGLMIGCAAEAGYAEVDGDIKPVSQFAVLMDIEDAAADANKDPVMHGILEHIDVNELMIKDDEGKDRSFDNAIGRAVAFSDLKPGDEVYVTYGGSIFDDGTKGEGSISSTPFVIKAVAADALESEDGKANYITGDYSEKTDGTRTLSTEVGEFTLGGDASLYAGLEPEKDVKAYYEGAVSDIELNVTRIEQ